MKQILAKMKNRSDKCQSNNSKYCIEIILLKRIEKLRLWPILQKRFRVKIKSTIVTSPHLVQSVHYITYPTDIRIKYWVN